MDRYRREKPKNSWGIVQDERGRVLGKVYSRSPMLEADVQVVKQFLCEIQKEKLMAKQNEKQLDQCNIVWLAGEIKTLKVRDDGSAFLLVDPTGDTKYIPCTVFDSKALTQILSRFQTEDTIQLRGYVRAWSQKKDGEWKNNTEVRVTEIRNKPPEREPDPARMRQQPMDDEIPF